MPSAERTEGWVSAPAPDRAADIHAAFLDPEVAVVLAAIGGNHSNQLLAHLDYELIREHPKVFQGYSDVTVLLWALFAHAGLRTFHGPALVPELGEFPSVLDYTDRWLRAAWLGTEQLRFEPVESWTDELLDWNVRADVIRPRELRPASGWATVRGGAAEGPLVGGSLEAIWWHLKGSDCWVEPAGAILFLETSELAYPPSMYDSALSDLENLGAFDAAAGLVFARPYGYDEKAKELLWRVLRERTEAAGIPVLADVDLGHADPMLTLPLGCPARLDTGAPSFHLLEPATAA